MKNNKGFVWKIIIIIAALIALKYYFQFDFIEWLKSPAVRAFWEPIWNLFVRLYQWLDVLVRGWVT
ncbi:MAG: hypothetical protein A3H52_02785 [Candidatus Zambryskibacteria bacterium RIFCSPLOWO2_02_FULL_39_26]|uniref:Uncharacterized protein n=1 Tax=Candidatus Zambryskibacteria bacterium RIFCSPLOWO2_12_FULL_39_23 TaxID=1802776 RepID=A0A1G2UQT9_9BACT|nr:MAG: hypothetical protein A2W51_00845 [Candidatus Zambryskibacteria bacterium RIFCSPHIGHO2_02_39_10]OHA99388.1 MAG: hypothetical protein A3E59_00505 [Candidatus Zambryskibacteria bacterium RIFCSPHIGHO2_12_FULL_39_47]OHB10378.1 MAG: hypothetical protein A3H52_02785 [Candidatus Zambryskibacteria bacterium RIFCSPLOWO2_02_FULL_39_26]OHB11733.1 MAG: hypothetical protein A3G99_03160 [Candidatus Zambryskibacteria bacterium RIFCSPLOWO2_12_FULL_39_23]